MVMKKKHFHGCGGSSVDRRVACDCVGGRPPWEAAVKIFGFFENISLNSLGYFSDTFGIFLKIFWTISLHIFSTGGSRVIALGDGPRGRAPLAPTKKVILTQFFNLTY